MTRPVHESTTAYERLADRIRERIVAGDLRPGDRLPSEPELTSSFDVSRNTAREALRALASQGLVRTKRGVGGGTFVAQPSAEHISGSLQTSLEMLTIGAEVPVSALLEVREMLEVPAAELAAHRRSDDELEALRGALFDPRDVDATDVFTSNRAFHTTVITAAHNPLLGLLAEPVFAVIEDRFAREDASPAFWRRVDREHREIAGYIESRDQAGAREAARAHLRHLRETYEQIDRGLHADDAVDS